MNPWKQLRTRKKLTQVELGRRLRVHNQFISNWERGLCAPPVKYFPKLSVIFGARMRDLVEIECRIHRDKIERRLGITNYRNPQ